MSKEHNECDTCKHCFGTCKGTPTFAAAKDSDAVVVCIKPTGDDDE